MSFLAQADWARSSQTLQRPAAQTGPSRQSTEAPVGRPEIHLGKALLIFTAGDSVSSVMARLRPGHPRLCRAELRDENAISATACLSGATMNCSLVVTYSVQRAVPECPLTVVK